MHSILLLWKSFDGKINDAERMQDAGPSNRATPDHPQPQPCIHQLKMAGSNNKISTSEIPRNVSNCQNTISQKLVKEMQMVVRNPFRCNVILG